MPRASSPSSPPTSPWTSPRANSGRAIQMPARSAQALSSSRSPPLSSRLPPRNTRPRPPSWRACPEPVEGGATVRGEPVRRPRRPVSNHTPHHPTLPGGPPSSRRPQPGPSSNHRSGRTPLPRSRMPPTAVPIPLHQPLTTAHQPPPPNMRCFPVPKTSFSNARPPLHPVLPHRRHPPDPRAPIPALRLRRLP